jgi:HK97 gp10 family phage protein
MIEVDLTGTDELNQKFENMVKAIGKEKLEPILLKKAKDMRTRIRANTPRGRTGNLRKGIIAKLLPRKENYPVVSMASINFKRAPHAGLVERGHGGPHPAPPHPFFHPVVEDNIDRIAREIKQEVIAEVERAMAR